MPASAWPRARSGNNSHRSPTSAGEKSPEINTCTSAVRAEQPHRRAELERKERDTVAKLYTQYLSAQRYYRRRAGDNPGAIRADYNQTLADLVWKYFADEIAEAVNRNAAGFRARTERMQKGR